MESIKLRVARRDPERKTSGWSEYDVDLLEKTTVLDCLDLVQRTTDPTLAFRYACRVGMCGSCAMVVNGKERWTCRTLVRDLRTPRLTIEPLKHLPVIRDLAVDFTPLWQKYRRVESAFEAAAPKRKAAGGRRPPLQKRKAVSRALIEPNLQCISCGACYSSCTFTGSDPQYLGPHAMNRVFTLVEDARDSARDRRLDIVDDEHGCWKCHIQQNCTEVCPMDISPSAGIQHLKRAIVEKRILSPSRRTFAFTALGGLLAAVVGYLVSEERREWVTAGPLSSVPEQGVLRFTHGRKSVFIRRSAAGSIVAISRKCTHQGCIVGWDPAADLYRCPCHLGTFNAAGAVVSGAPYRPLEIFETRVEGDDIQVFM